MIRDTAAAVKSRLEQDPVLATCTFEGLVTDKPERYASFFLNSGVRYGDRLSGPDVSADFTLTVHSVGSDPYEAQAVAERVLAQLLNYKLVVAGRDCSLLRHTASIPISSDDVIGASLFYGVDEFSFTSDPV